MGTLGEPFGHLKSSQNVTGTLSSTVWDPPEPTGLILEPPGVDFGASGVDFGASGVDFGTPFHNFSAKNRFSRGGCASRDVR